MSTTIAFTGLGAMGAPMAENLLAAGFALRVWNRGPGRTEPLAARGATVCATPAQAVQAPGRVRWQATRRRRARWVGVARAAERAPTRRSN